MKARRGEILPSSPFGVQVRAALTEKMEALGFSRDHFIVHVENHPRMIWPIAAVLLRYQTPTLYVGDWWLHFLAVGRNGGLRLDQGVIDLKTGRISKATWNILNGDCAREVAFWKRTVRQIKDIATWLVRLNGPGFYDIGQIAGFWRKYQTQKKGKK